MDLSLTEAERQAAEAMIRRTERRARQWPWARICLLLVVALTLGAGGLAFAVMVSLNKGLISPMSADTTPLTAELLAVQVQLRFMAVLVVSSLYVCSVICWLIGALTGVYTALNWGRQHRDAVLAKILRAQVQALGPG